MVPRPRVDSGASTQVTPLGETSPDTGFMGRNKRMTNAFFHVVRSLLQFSRHGPNLAAAHLV